ncbi:MAG: DUF2255 family protein [Myxococcota bacterium]
MAAIRPILLAVIVAFGSVRGVRADAPLDWSRYADVRTVQVITTNEDGSPRETTVWLVVVGGRGYLRTGTTRWGANLERNPRARLRIGEEEIPVRIEFVEDEPTRERVTRAFRGKYGLKDRIMSVFRGSHPKIMRLSRRPGD